MSNLVVVMLFCAAFKAYTGNGLADVYPPSVVLMLAFAAALKDGVDLYDTVMWWKRDAEK